MKHTATFLITLILIALSFWIFVEHNELIGVACFIGSLFLMSAIETKNREEERTEWYKEYKRSKEEKDS